LYVNFFYLFHIHCFASRLFVTDTVLIIANAKSAVVIIIVRKWNLYGKTFYGWEVLRSEITDPLERDVSPRIINIPIINTSYFEIIHASSVA
jgi:hypothetical protein